MIALDLMPGWMLPDAVRMVRILQHLLNHKRTRVVEHTANSLASEALTG